ncbi:sigma-54 interaction domain-containing protein [Sporosarcina sp. YIM B06819]|uniref:sigma-54 interaction domain-containing protein n=1 Tax=Sporosarcina sp. YIM B06819 TaxID=3081769 RepID=UPI00298C6F6F|nr:sigma 54-interacting transcriptional regulator [Sporosarcina sp. YIM B06819]
MDHLLKSQLDLLAGYDNVLVVNDQGETLYYDVADLAILVKLGHRPEDFIGKKILSFYTNLSEEESTIMTVLRTGKAMMDVEQRLATKTGIFYTSKSSTYPIIEDEKIIGAIEFSSHFFDKDHIQHFEGYAGHPIYRKNGTQYTMEDLIVDSSVMASLKEQLQRIAKSDTTILLYGKTGTGKNVVAQSLHNASSRFAAPFVTLDCGALSGEVMERVLFGLADHVLPGMQGSPAIFEKAQGGTLFLDEVNVLPLDMQARLLKVIGEKRVRRIGGTEEILLDLRVISAMNEDPEELVRNKRLREDFFYRLSVLRVNLPELKNRQEDIRAFVDHFIRFYNSRMDMRVTGVEDSVVERFLAYSWPGNIRELRNAIESAFNHVKGTLLTAEDFPPEFNPGDRSTDTAETKNVASNLRDTLDNYERLLIQTEYQKADGVLAETARKLGISKQSLKYKLDKYGLRL